MCDFGSDIQDEEKKLTQEQEQYNNLKVQRQGQRALKTSKKLQLNAPKKPKKPTVAHLREELADLQAKYTQLCSKFVNT